MNIDTDTLMLPSLVKQSAVLTGPRISFLAKIDPEGFKALNTDSIASTTLTPEKSLYIASAQPRQGLSKLSDLFKP